MDRGMFPGELACELKLKISGRRCKARCDCISAAKMKCRINPCKTRCGNKVCMLGPLACGSWGCISMFKSESEVSNPDAHEPTRARSLRGANSFRPSCIHAASSCCLSDDTATGLSLASMCSHMSLNVARTELNMTLSCVCSKSQNCSSF